MGASVSGHVAVDARRAKAAPSFSFKWSRRPVVSKGKIGATGPVRGLRGTGLGAVSGKSVSMLRV